MNIKNIRDYRSFYKEKQIKHNDANEHFIGNIYYDENDESQIGWFSLVHGDKSGYDNPEEGIRNFLKSFLDMARDGQAVYEFLQNSVDAGASHFTMVWGKDEIDGNYYLMVANNGEMFNYESIRSILNVGSSTKADNEGASDYQIGKFGIGFKLSHRLVGKENGLDELISNDPTGPILFSWKNNELLELANESDIAPINIEVEKKGRDYLITDDNPWFFKILATCFPAMPENSQLDDSVFLFDGKTLVNTLFPASEVKTFQRWIRDHSTIFENNNYRNGSAFFLKLGENKQNDLADKNLELGTRFSLAVLQKTVNSNSRMLNSIQLNNESISKPDLNYLVFHITNDRESDDFQDYIYVRYGKKNISELNSTQARKIEQQANIEILFGFRPHNNNDDFFEGAPNLYLYFPLSEEVHNFDFILHSNAFYKGSSRTFLHRGTTEGDSINERLFKVIASRLKKEMRSLYDNEEYEKFLDLYAAILTSRESDNQQRNWIKKPFLEPLEQLLRDLIPVRNNKNNGKPFAISSEQLPFIKHTSIDFSVSELDQEDIDWFYWDGTSNDKIISSAIKKLGLKEFYITDLLENTNGVQIINSWTRLSELNLRTVLEELSNSTDFKESGNKIKKVNLFKFSEDEILSAENLLEKQSTGYVVKFKDLANIDLLLERAGLKLTSINYKKYNIFQTFSSYYGENDNQLRQPAVIIEIFNDCCDLNIVRSFSPEEKSMIFSVFKNLVGEEKKIEKLSKLSLFNNRLGECRPLENLLKSTEIEWLSPFLVDDAEYNEAIRPYLLSKQKYIYSKLIHPCWASLGQHIKTMAKNELEDIFSAIDRYYQEGLEQDESLSKLSDTGYIFFHSSLGKHENLYQLSNPQHIEQTSYENIQQVLYEKLSISIPDWQFSVFYDTYMSLQISNEANVLNFKKLTLSKEELDVLFKFYSLEKQIVFDNSIVENNHGLYVLNNDSDKKTYYSSNRFIVDYIHDYHSKELAKLPEEFKHYSEHLELTDDNLLSYLICRINTDDNDQVLKLVSLIKESSTKILVSFFKAIDSINLDGTWINMDSNQVILKIGERLAEAENSDYLRIYQSKLTISDEKIVIKLGDIDSAQDKIEINYHDRLIALSRAKLLGDKTEDVTEKLFEFYDNACKNTNIDINKLRMILKISDEGITDNLLEKFETNLIDKHLCNIDQLLLVIFANRIDDEQKTEYKVESLKGKWYPLKGNWFAIPDTDTSYFNDDFVLSDERYDGLWDKINQNDDTVLKITEDDSYTKDYGQNIIMNGFVWHKGVEAQVLNYDCEDVKLIQYLYNRWLTHKESDNNSTLGKKWDWSKVLSFDPKYKIIFSYILPSESLDDKITSWLSEPSGSYNDKIDFLDLLGVKSRRHDVCKLRKHLAFNDPLPEDFKHVDISPKLLANTLNLLAEDTKERWFSIQGSKLEQLNQIIHFCLKSNISVENVRVPIYVNSRYVKLASKQLQNPVRVMPEDFKTLRDSKAEYEINSLYQSIPILYEGLYEEIFASFSNAKLNWTFYKEDQHDAVEINERIYREWAEKYNIRLYIGPKLNYLLHIHGEEAVHEMGFVKHDGYDYEILDGITHLYHSRNLSNEGLLDKLVEDNEQDIAQKLEELNSQRTRIITKILSNMTNSDEDEFLAKMLAKKEKEQKRSEYKEEIKEKQIFSHAWFIAYLNILSTFEEKAQADVKLRSLTFYSIENHFIEGRKSDRFFLLKSCNGLMPYNIDSYTDFKIRIVFRSGMKEQEVNVEGVSRRGHDLLASIPKGLPSSVANNLENAIAIKIEFRAVLDLNERLKKAFKTIKPWTDIKEEAPPLTFIYGPPGTGKTTNICLKIGNAFNDNPGIKALILVPTNKAGDVLAHKLIETDPYLSVVRLGAPTDPELAIEDEDIYRNSVSEQDLQQINVLITTIHRLPYFQISESEYEPLLFNKSNFWDFLVFDEASMTGLSFAAFALMSIGSHSPNTNMLISGDPKQIPPVLDIDDNELEEIDLSDYTIYTMFGIDSFDPSQQEKKKRPKDIIENLNTQYRSVETIGKVFSEYAYEGILKHGRNIENDPPKLLPKGYFEELSSPVNFISVPIDREDSVIDPTKKLNRSSYHLYSGIFVLELLKHFDKCNNSAEYSIGVLSPYKAQALLMSKLLASSGISEKLSITCDTVHGFQGDEFDIVIFVINPNNMKYTGNVRAHLSKEYIYNVAISRARDYLWIVHPFDNIRDNVHVNKIRSIANKGYSNSNAIERKLFNDSDFILKNSCLIGHDSVNVFGKLEMQYFLKVGDYAMDIQIRE